MKMKHNKFMALLLGLACVTGFTACDDDSDDLSAKSELSAPVLSNTYGDYCSLDFEWNSVPNTTQYGYKLYDPEGAVVCAGVTQDTSVYIEGLKSETTYILRVWAFAGLDTDYTTSPAAEITATTGALVKLVTPADLSVSGTKGAYTASWDAVADAESYSYAIYTSASALVKSGTVKAPKTSVSISKLGHEQDFYITVQAITTESGYIDSDIARTEFNYIPGSKDISWQANGSYYSYMYDDEWDATLTCYIDGFHQIKSFYGVDGYNLDFILDQNNIPTLLTGELYVDGGYKYWLIPTGISYLGEMYYIYAYIWDNYLYFDGDSTAGEFGIGNYGYDPYGWGYDTFTW